MTTDPYTWRRAETPNPAASRPRPTAVSQPQPQPSIEPSEPSIEPAAPIEGTGEDARAEKQERTAARERAESGEGTEVPEPAVEQEGAEDRERAVELESTGKVERADVDASAVPPERADVLESTAEGERPRRLNLGCGPEPPPGWTSVDLHEYGQSQINQGWCGDLVAGLPYPGGRFAYAVSHHALQMLGYPDLVGALAEIRRVLAADGVLRISVPDLRGALDAWLAADAPWFPIVDEAETQLGGKLCAYVTWYGEARTVFTPGWLAELCVRAGFGQTAVCCAGLTLLADPAGGICDLDSRPRESIYLEAQR